MCMHRNRNPCNSLLMVNMDCGHGHPTTTSRNIAALLELIPSLAALVYSMYLWYWTSMLWSIDTCQNKVSADQCHVTILRAQVLVFFWSWPLTKCWFSIESQAHVLLICGDQGQTVRKVVNGNQVDRSMNFSSIQLFFTACFVKNSACVTFAWRLRVYFI